jgi:phage regulator Rha-like protein
MKSVNGVLMMGSSEIAVVTDKEPKHVVRDIKQCWNNWVSMVQIWTIMI